MRILWIRLASMPLHIPWLHCTCVKHSSGPDDPPPADEQIEAHDEINEAITAFFAEQPFSSIRDISKLPISPNQQFTGNRRKSLDLPCSTFGGCCIFCRNVRNARGWRCRESSYGHSAFRQPGPGMTLSHSTSHGFISRMTMSLSD
jgi:hypothetical protein